ncbi:MAG: ABC transporter ATP-binding protein [Psychrosphaera sp.]|nr:ABC transporter ATP-binding protein [Psychrosphaera sp.]
MSQKVIIELNNVSRVFYVSDMETHAVSQINLKIYEGDYLSIVGPSGSGKSTLLSILGLLDKPSEGEYLIDGIATSTLDRDQLADLRNLHLGFIFQSFNLIDELSVFDNVALPLTYQVPKKSKEEIHKQVMLCLTKVNMEHRTKHKPNQLSGGQQQRVAIARALVGEPDILLVDEPTGNLDSKNSDAVVEILKDLNQGGTTICMVTHDARHADCAKRKCHLLDGKLVEDQIQGVASELA